MMVMKITIVALGEMLAPARKDQHWQLGAIKLTKSDAYGEQ